VNVRSYAQLSLQVLILIHAACISFCTLLKVAEAVATPQGPLQLVLLYRAPSSSPQGRRCWHTREEVEEVRWA
jgi:hypothetical protein